MNKSELKYGNVVELRNGDKFLFTFYLENGHEESIFMDLYGKGYYHYYSSGLSFNNNHKNSGNIIMKVYKDFTFKELLWERKEKPKLSADEKAILRNIDKDYKWIVRSLYGSIWVYRCKPDKDEFGWNGRDLERLPFNHLFQFITWEDDEPYSIEDLLKGE